MNDNAEQRSTHWVEHLFPPTFSIRDYRSTFKPDEQRVRRYITTLSTYDGPTLAAIYEQSYLFTLIQRLAHEEFQRDEQQKHKNKSNQTQPIDSILDIRLIRDFLEKHQRNNVENDPNNDQLWNSDDIAIIRSAYVKVRDDSFKYKSESEFYQNQLTKVRNDFDEMTKQFEKLRDEHFELKKIHKRWTMKSNANDQLVEEQRRENRDLNEHMKILTEQNENFRRDFLQIQKELREKQMKIEQFERQIEHYDRTLKNECNRRIDLMEKRSQVEKDRLNIEKHDLKSKLDKEENLRRQNLLALDQLRKHLGSVNATNIEQSSCEIKNVKFV